MSSSGFSDVLAQIPSLPAQLVNGYVFTPFVPESFTNNTGGNCIILKIDVIDINPVENSVLLVKTDIGSFGYLWGTTVGAGHVTQFTDHYDGPYLLEAGHRLEVEAQTTSDTMCMSIFGLVVPKHDFFQLDIFP